MVILENDDDFIVAVGMNTLTFDQCEQIQIYMGIKNAFSMPMVPHASPIPLKQ